MSLMSDKFSNQFSSVVSDKISNQFSSVVSNDFGIYLVDSLSLLCLYHIPPPIDQEKKFTIIPAGP